jgi:hypothetical protein
MLVYSNLSFTAAAFSVMEDHVKYTRNIRINIYTGTLVAVIVINMYRWTLTLREEHRLRASENGTLRMGRRGGK